MSMAKQSSLKPINRIFSMFAFIVVSSIASHATQLHNVVFIDPGVQDAQSLADGVLPGYEVVLLDARHDPLVQMTEALEHISGGEPVIESVHVISHGAPGALVFSAAVIDSQHAERNAEMLRSWRSMITPDASLALYGCNVARNPAGFELIDRLDDLTGMNVAASSTVTGSVTSGGDWRFEVSTNPQNVNSAITRQVQHTYQYAFLTFDFESANGAVENAGTPKTITQTVSGVQLTVTVDTNRSDEPDLLDAGGAAGTSGNVAITGNASATTNMILAFNSAVDVTSLVIANADPGASAVTFKLTANGGSTTTTNSLNESTGETVTLNWTNVTSITIENNAGGSFYIALDTIIFTPSASNNAPTITDDGLGNLVLQDNATRTVFDKTTSYVTIADADADNLTVTVLIQSGQTRGDFTSASTSGWTRTTPSGDIQYQKTFNSDSGTAASAAVRALDFDPRENAITPGTTEKTYFTISVNDGTVTTNSDAEMSVVVTSMNDAPTISSAGSVALNEDAVYTFSTSDFHFSDVDSGDTLSAVGIATTVSAGTFWVDADGSGTKNNAESALTNGATVTASDITANRLKFNPVPDANGSSYTTFSFVVSDGTASSSSSTMTIDVNAVNDAPSLTLDGNRTVLEDAGAQSVVQFATFAAGGGSDESGQTPTYTVVVTSGGSLFSASPAINSSGTLSFTPASNAAGVASVSVTVNDGGGTANGGVATADQTFSITITGVNDAPGLTLNGNQTVLEDAGAQSIVQFATFTAGGGSDESGQTPTYTVAVTSGGSLFSASPAINSSGTLTFTSASNAAGVASVS
ncbi:MAG: DUF4347 domain-containing protein, partial [bacterium]|nr:DUF4347 domain-containing protein [bacterium]